MVLSLFAVFIKSITDAVAEHLELRLSKVTTSPPNSP